MKKTKLLAGAVVAAIGGLAMTSIASATAPVTVEQNGDLTVCGTEYVSDSNGAEGCITIQGKNVGATTTGAGPSAPDTSYGNYYQRGNNYGFSSNGSVTTSNEQIDCSTYNPLHPFSSSTFIIPPNGSFHDYCISRNDNLWGGGSDNNGLVYPVENGRERRGPCDEGYHVPSQGEWYALMDMWEGSSINGLIFYNISQFYTDFQIPFAGFRDVRDGSVLDQGGGANLWSSSPSVDENARGFYIDEYQADPNMDHNRSYGHSVRCFKDSDIGSSSSEGGDSEIIVNIAEFNGGQNTCSGSNFIFENIVAGTSTGTHTLSGVFQCAFGNGRSSSTVTLQLSGNLVADGDRVISGSNLMMKNSEWTVSPVGLKFANTLISTWRALTATQTLFQKTANLIGVASGVVEVQLTVPGGTPDGTYNGVLVLTY